MTWELFYFQIFSDLKSRIGIAVFKTVFSANMLAVKFSIALCCFAVESYVLYEFRESQRGANKNELRKSYFSVGRRLCLLLVWVCVWLIIC